jgi:small subunit ribosomal protein S9
VDSVESAKVKAMAKPTSCAYFTGNPVYFDFISRLESELQNFNLSLDATLPETATPPKWVSKEEMARMLGIQLKVTHYEKIVLYLSKLTAISSPPKTIQDLLTPFQKVIDIELEKERQAKVDENGVAHAQGFRKEAKAKVSVLRGDGEIMINGKPLAEFFNRMHDRETVVYPFQVTNTLGEWNAWVLVEGGGPSGKAEAIAHGIAQCLAAHKPEVATALDEGHLVVCLIQCFADIFPSWCITSR